MEIKALSEEILILKYEKIFSSSHEICLLFANILILDFRVKSFLTLSNIFPLMYGFDLIVGKSHVIVINT